MGLNFKLDVGLYRLDQQVACQRYRQNEIDAKSDFSKALEKATAYRDSLKVNFALAA